MLISYKTETGLLTGATILGFELEATEYTAEEIESIRGMHFSEALPAGEAPCYIILPEAVRQIWGAVVDGRPVTVMIDGRGNYAGAQFGDAPPPQEPEPEKTPEQRIAELEAENADLKSRLVDVEFALTDLFTMGGV